MGQGEETHEMTDETPQDLLGSFIRAQRQLANLSLRQLSALTEVSNPYLSQIERGLHRPSLHVLRSIADALNVSTENLLEYAGLIDHDGASDEQDAADRAIRSDRRLTEAQRAALLAVYRSYVEANEANEADR
jgi:predicted transcriptional regulator